MWLRSVAEVSDICVGKVISQSWECDNRVFKKLDVALWELFISKLILRSPSISTSSAMFKILSNEIFLRIVSNISVKLSKLELGGLYMIPIILNFLRETFTFPANWEHNLTVAYPLQ